MSVANFSRYAELSPETAKQIMGRIMTQIGNQQPAGAIFHAEGPSNDGGWWTFDVWESDDAAQQFMDNFVNPVLSSFNVHVDRESPVPGRLGEQSPRETPVTTGSCWKAR